MTTLKAEISLATRTLRYDGRRSGGITGRRMLTVPTMQVFVRLRPTFDPEAADVKSMFAVKGGEPPQPAGGAWPLSRRHQEGALDLQRT